MTVGNTQAVGVSYSDPNFARLWVGGVEIVAPSDVALLSAVAGTATASKAVILDANKAIDAVRTAALYIGTSGSETQVTATAAELNVLHSVTAGTVAASKALVVDANKDLSALRNLTLTNLDAGASGTAGSVDIFPSTASKGKTTFTAADNSGDTTTTINTATQAGARTYTVPDAGASASFVMSTGASTATTATSTELSKIAGIPASVTVVVTTPDASGTCDVAMTFKDAAGVTCAAATWMPFFLSGIDGLSITAAITGIITASTPVGAVGVTVTGQQGFVVTTAAGLASVKLSGANATTYYLTFRGPGGKFFVSPALLTKA